MNFIKTALGRLRLIAFLEGLSFILLIGIAVPLKYYFGYQHATQGIGMVHGILFITYVLLLNPVREKHAWSWTQFLMAFVASVVPFGTFVAEYRLFRTVKV